MRRDGGWTFEGNMAVIPPLDTAGRRAVAEILADMLVRDFLRDLRGSESLRPNPAGDPTMSASEGR
jgi:hypothetical protein